MNHLPAAQGKQCLLSPLIRSKDGLRLLRDADLCVRDADFQVYDLTCVRFKVFERIALPCQFSTFREAVSRLQTNGVLT
jgi:hypothetical protein